MKHLGLKTFQDFIKIRRCRTPIWYCRTPEVHVAADANFHELLLSPLSDDFYIDLIN